MHVLWWIFKELVPFNVLTDHAESWSDKSSVPASTGSSIESRWNILRSFLMKKWQKNYTKNLKKKISIILFPQTLSFYVSFP